MIRMLFTFILLLCFFCSCVDDDQQKTSYHDFLIDNLWSVEANLVYELTDNRVDSFSFHTEYNFKQDCLIDASYSPTDYLFILSENEKEITIIFTDNIEPNKEAYLSGDIDKFSIIQKSEDIQIWESVKFGYIDRLEAEGITTSTYTLTRK